MCARCPLCKTGPSLFIIECIVTRPVQEYTLFCRRRELILGSQAASVHCSPLVPGPAVTAESLQYVAVPLLFASIRPASNRHAAAGGHVTRGLLDSRPAMVALLAVDAVDAAGSVRVRTLNYVALLRVLHHITYTARPRRALALARRCAAVEAHRRRLPSDLRAKRVVAQMNALAVPREAPPVAHELVPIATNACAEQREQ